MGTKRKQGKWGRPTRLTRSLLSKIRKGVLAGKMYKTIKEELKIPNSTWDTWYFEDTKGFRKDIDNWKREAMLIQADKNMEYFLRMKTINTGVTKKGDTFEYDDAKMKRIKFDATTHVQETIGKEVYSKRQELTGAKGTPLMGNLLDQIIKQNENNTGPDKTV